MKTLTPAQKAFKAIKADTAEAVKKRIQAILRKIALVRDETCLLAPYQGKDGIPYCNGYRQDGELVLQYDHLNSRSFNVSYADPDLGVLVCKGHHGWKHSTDNNKKQYDELVRKIIGPARTKKWDRVEKDRRTYPMSKWEWEKVELGLHAQLAKVEALEKK